MILAIRASDPRFREPRLRPGLNLVVATGTTKKKGRNALGKTTFVDIIDFLLGGDGQRLKVEALKEWWFEADIEFPWAKMTVRRAVGKSDVVLVSGLPADWAPGSLFPATNDVTIPVARWTELLGRQCFGLEQPSGPFLPTFRALCNYFVRPPGGFLDPFETRPKQVRWQREVYNAFLLMLPWELSVELRRVEEAQRELATVARSAKSGQMRQIIGDVPELEDRLATVRRRVQKLKAEIDGFRVHPEYEQIRAEGDAISAEIRDLRDKDFLDRQMLDGYRHSLDAESSDEAGDVDALYAEAGMAFPEQVRRTLAEVRSFHAAVLRNRRDFLAEEMRRLAGDVAERERRLQELDRKRADVVGILRSTGALGDFTVLQERLSGLKAEEESLRDRVASIRAWDRAKAELESQQASLAARLRVEDDAHEAPRTEAMTLFHELTDKMVMGGGRLIMQPGRRGYDFDHKLQGKPSEGRKKVAVYAYDMTLAAMWARRNGGLGFCVHDSEMFSGMDDAQKTPAFDVGMAMAAAEGFQHIVTISSDRVPDGFPLADYQCLELHDRDPSGSLLGFRYELPSADDAAKRADEESEESDEASEVESVEET